MDIADWRKKIDELDGRLVELLSERALRTPFVRLAKEGDVLPAMRFTASGGFGAQVADQVDSAMVLREFAAGATIVLQGLHRSWPPLRAFTRRLAAELGHPAQVNAYITPESARGFDAHYDVHDVFVLQVSGEKHWSVHAPVREHPRPDEAWSQRRAAVESRAREKPVIDVVLRPGDALYLPSGWLHSAVARSGPSIHLTVGVAALTGADVIRELVAEQHRAVPHRVDPGEHRFALPEHDRGQGEMQLIDQPGAKILTRRLDATADLHVATIGGLFRPVQRRLDTVGHEDEGGAAFHLDRIARMVRQHEGRRVIGRIVAPPALPALVRPRTADRPEHIAAEDERAEPVHRTICVGLIDAVRAPVLTDHCLEHARTEHPLVQFQPAFAERIFKALLRPCSETVERD